MRSMTGFGRGQATGEGYRLSCEVKTVNHRGLDVKARLARELSALELRCLAAVKQAVVRGRVDLIITVARDVEAPAGHVFDAARAERVVDEVLAFARRKPVVASVLTAGDLLHVRDLVQVARPDDEPPQLAAPEVALDRALGQALGDLDGSRRTEGQGLKADLVARLAASVALVEQLRGLTRGAPQRLHEKLRARLAALDLKEDVDPQRLAAEVALLAERADVAEELARLDVHVAHFRALLDDEEAVGRKLDFLCQELMREANTTGSKVQDAATAHVVVELKAEIERLREQAQNVE